VIDGISRDVALCRALGYPMFSRGHWMRTGKDRVQVEALGCAVDIGGVRVEQGDLLRGDADGLVALPQAHEEAVLAAAEDIAKAEDAIRAACREGMRLDEARRQFRYHSLQTRQAD
jgi:4-hydroxy-4-methyl-2-oxoglutarate aldolase